MSAARELAERVGERHDGATMLEARRRTQAAVQDVARQVVPGMAEEEGLELTQRMLRAHGFEGDWVAPYLRFGTNTLKKYAEPSDPGVVLAHDDVWFVDVGPLWRGHQCDYAETFAVGKDPERHRMACDVREIFQRTQGHWRSTRATGVEPDAELHEGYLAHAEFTPSPGLWMLEVQIRHPERPYGAFFEDLLLDP
jgi:Xaa-Pro aminopeptidase